jgi:hypothetical protein
LFDARRLLSRESSRGTPQVGPARLSGGSTSRLEPNFSWEPWHFAFTRGPELCSEAANSIGAGGGDGESASSGGLPSFVPARRVIFEA